MRALSLTSGGSRRGLLGAPAGRSDRARSASGGSGAAADRAFFQAVSGRGIQQALVNGRDVLLGNQQLMKTNYGGPPLDARRGGPLSSARSGSTAAVRCRGGSGAGGASSARCRHLKPGSRDAVEQFTRSSVLTYGCDRPITGATRMPSPSSRQSIHVLARRFVLCLIRSRTRSLALQQGGGACRRHVLATGIKKTMRRLWPRPIWVSRLNCQRRGMAASDITLIERPARNRDGHRTVAQYGGGHHAGSLLGVRRNVVRIPRSRWGACTRCSVSY